jgi:hypothetical protein
MPSGGRWRPQRICPRGRTNASDPRATPLSRAGRGGHAGTTPERLWDGSVLVRCAQGRHILAAQEKGDYDVDLPSPQG